LDTEKNKNNNNQFTQNPLHIDKGFGVMNGHAAGIVMREVVRMAINTIRNERIAFEVKSKQGHSGGMDDVLTSADTKAQELYLRVIQECFPNYGIIAEEDAMQIMPKNGVNAYFTIDPLDGTKAFVRRQSHGVGTMIALVEHGKVVSAYVGDINTNEIYGFRPGSDRVRRITGFNTSEILKHKAKGDLKNQYVMLRDPEHKYSPPAQKVIRTQFKNVFSDGGSIGIWLARLWKREVAAALIPPFWETPWDITPLIGISKKLGYVYLKPTGNAYDDKWVRFEPRITTKKYKANYDTLIVHESDLNQLTDILENP
jgi:fructose-1,6-bisphosphatase/inositol monophosphatase family enzyme